MFASRFSTKQVSTITGGASAAQPEPTVLVQEIGHDCAVKVRNNSLGSYVLISFDTAALASFTGPIADNTFKVPAGLCETFVLAKGQSLYASSPGLGAEVSVHVYESFPVDP